MSLLTFGSGKKQTELLANHLPVGDAWLAKNQPDSNLYKILQGLSVETSRLDDLVALLVKEMNIDTTEKLIDLWEESVGIPDDCFKGTGSIEERRSHVKLKIGRMNGVVTSNDFEIIANALGFDVEIKQGADNAIFPMDFPLSFEASAKEARFTMIAQVDGVVPPNIFPLAFPFVFGGSAANVLTCVIENLAPAEVNVRFEYIGAINALFINNLFLNSLEILDWDYNYFRYNDTINYMPSPFDPGGWYGNITDADLAYTQVNERNSSGESFWGEFEYVGSGGTATFALADYTSFFTGEKLYTCVLIDKTQYEFIRFVIQEASTGVVSDFRYDFVNEIVGLNTASVDFKRTDISASEMLLEVEYFVPSDGDYRGSIWGEPFSGAMPVGEKIKLQAAYFGKSSDYPALIGVDSSNTNTLEQVIDGEYQIYSGAITRNEENGLEPFSGTEATKIQIRWKRVSPVGPDNNYIEWATENDTEIGGSKIVTFASDDENTSSPDEDGFYTTIIETSGLTDWAGETIIAVRVNMWNAINEKQIIDSIKVGDL